MGTDTGHIPVLYEEVLAGLDVRPGGRYIDATVGAGGYARGILERSAPDGRLLGFDADSEAIRFARDVLQPFGDRVTLQAANFRDVHQCSTDSGFDQVDGVVMDLGLSSRQLADGERGFAFAQDGPLDMRFDRGTGRTAEELVNRQAEAELANLLWRYGEERQSRRIARAIVAARPVKTTVQLAEVVAGAVGRREKIHPATRTFQALRIAVNDELGALSQALPQACELLGPRGRLAVVAFHSLEDRIVKHFMQQEACDCICPPEAPVCVCGHRARLRIVTRRPIRPTEGETERNPRSRSARLRVAERLGGEGGPPQARSVRERY